MRSGLIFGTQNRNPTELERFGSGSGFGFWSVISVITELCSPLAADATVGRPANGQISDRCSLPVDRPVDRALGLTWRSTARSTGAIYREQKLSGGRPALGCARLCTSVDRPVDRCAPVSYTHLTLPTIYSV